jgi:hypothetical protein
MKRAHVGEQQPEFPFPVPVPAIGTVIIMRIEDFRGVPPQAPGAVAAPARLQSDQERVRAWLHGHASPASYGAGVSRGDDGRVVATTTRALAAACLDGQALTLRGQEMAAAALLKRMGWRSRRDSDSARTYRFHPPAGWR